MIICTDVSVKKSQNVLLKNISLEIPAGRITCLLGASGAGKTTLLRTIAQLSGNYEGSIIIDGNEDSSLTPQQLSSRIGFVFQQFNLFGFLTVLENCMIALRLVKGFSEQKAQVIAMSMLEKLGISALAGRLPSQISGGQQQRVAIARALALNPKSLLLDEPTSSLDPANAAILAGLLKGLAKQGIAIAVASQDSVFIRMVLDRAYLLSMGQLVESCDSHLQEQLTPTLEQFFMIEHQEK